MHQNDVIGSITSTAPFFSLCASRRVPPSATRQIHHQTYLAVESSRSQHKICCHLFMFVSSTTTCLSVLLKNTNHNNRQIDTTCRQSNQLLPVRSNQSISKVTHHNIIYLNHGTVSYSILATSSKRFKEFRNNSSHKKNQQHPTRLIQSTYIILQ